MRTTQMKERKREGRAGVSAEWGLYGLDRPLDGAAAVFDESTSTCNLRHSPDDTLP